MRDGELPTSAFEYTLPRELIARVPAHRREESRLAVLDRGSGAIRHGRFRDLPDLFEAGDVLVVNETRVLHARLRGRKRTGGRGEVLLLRPAGGDLDARTWDALVRPGARLRAGAVLEIADDLSIEVLEPVGRGVRRVRLRTGLDTMRALERYGLVPLPPYIDREPTAADADRYQTVYARVPGSVAAPTAGLHFSADLIATLERRGVRIVRLLLHVGVGTFRPVEAEDPGQHEMHAEWYRVDAHAAATINGARASGARIWAVGTTVVRTLETVATDRGVEASEGETRLFIRPPYRCRAVDRLVTNFHLPRSTLLMLVAAFGGYDLVMRAYDEAIRERYRFYSYGDAMAVL